MLSNITPEQIKDILAALQVIHVKAYGHESSTDKWNAQRNLSGRTHYVDDDTLRFHKSKILDTWHEYDGLLFCLAESCSLDWEHTRRGFRVVVFDVFGTVLSRPDLAHAHSTKNAARNAARKETIDLAAHYRKALRDQLHYKQEQYNEYLRAVNMLPEPVPALESEAA